MIVLTGEHGEKCRILIGLGCFFSLLESTPMSRLYRSLRVVARWSLGIYFFDIQASGQEEIPEEGPLIFAANHPNSLMDTVVLGTQTERQIQYMAREGLFHKSPIVKALFNHIGVIPIYRPDDGQMERNVYSFEMAYEALEEGSCIGIFPEGTNSPDRQVRKLKTGTARIALATEARNDFELGLKVQPVGLNFEDRDRFLSSVLIRFGKPIDVREYGELYARDEREAVQALTDRLEEDLKSLAMHIEDSRNRQLVIDIHDIYGNELARDLIGDLNLNLDLRPLTHKLIDRARAADGPRPDLEDRFTLERYIAQAVDYYQKKDPGMVARVRMDIRRYRDHLAQVRLRHQMLEEGVELTGRRREALKMTIYALGLGPVAVWGAINNAIPYSAVRFVVRRTEDEAVVAFAGFLSGLLGFPLFYFLQGWALWTLTDHSLVGVIIYLVSLPIAGFFFLRWWRQILAYRDRILSRTLFRTEKNLLDTLNRERLSLIETFEELKEEYFEQWKRQIQDQHAPNGILSTGSAELPTETAIVDVDADEGDDEDDSPSQLEQTAN